VQDAVGGDLIGEGNRRISDCGINDAFDYLKSPFFLGEKGIIKSSSLKTSEFCLKRKNLNDEMQKILLIRHFCEKI
jgi:hypothetical protein